MKEGIQHEFDTNFDSSGIVSLQLVRSRFYRLKPVSNRVSLFPLPYPHPSPLHSITISLQNSTPFAVAFICNNIRQYLSNVSHQRNLSRAITTSLLFTDINSTGKHGKINIYRPIFPFEQRRNNYQDVVEQKFLFPFQNRIEEKSGTKSKNA